MYEYSTLTAEECPNAAEIFNFDAISFCCPDVTEPPNKSCSICPSPGVLSHPEKPVFTEFFGEVKCNEMATHAQFLPNNEDACIELLFELDLRDNEDCCDLPEETKWTPDGGSGTVNGPDGDTTNLDNDTTPANPGGGDADSAATAIAMMMMTKYTSINSVTTIMTTMIMVGVTMLF